MQREDEKMKTHAVNIMKCEFHNKKINEIPDTFSQGFLDGFLSVCRFSSVSIDMPEVKYYCLDINSDWENVGKYMISSARKFKEKNVR